MPAARPPDCRVVEGKGGGAARDFAHIGAIRALEAQGIVPDLIVGASAGAVVGALYAAGNGAFYFALVFGADFVLWPIRLFSLVPLLVVPGRARPSMLE